MAKGSNFEREICKDLSLWWTQDLDEPRDDIFWRSSQSGGRATTRAKVGKRTYGSYGDITAVDPIGEPLLKVFTIELKRGYSTHTPMDLIECPGKKVRPFGEFILQAIRSHEMAGSKSWMLICRRDRRLAMVYFPTKLLMGMNADMLAPNDIRYRVVLNRKRVHFIGFRLDDFLERVTPQKIVDLL